MGRVHRGGSSPRPSGPRWDAYRQQLIAGWFRAGRACWFCNHGFRSAQLITVEHRISPVVRPDLAWARCLDNGEPQLVPAHGGGRYRCPECDLSCQHASSNAPDAPRKNGASMPFTESFMARQMELRRRFLAKSGGIKTQRREVPGTLPQPFRGEIGRVW